jgi:peptidoglycan/LPS O-acetylase OafA/YrhL
MLKSPKPVDPLQGLRGLAAVHVMLFFCRAELRMLKSPKPLDPLQGLRGLAAVHVMVFHNYQPVIG